MKADRAFTASTLSFLVSTPLLGPAGWNVINKPAYIRDPVLTHEWTLSVRQMEPSKKQTEIRSDSQWGRIQLHEDESD